MQTIIPTIKLAAATTTEIDSDDQYIKGSVELCTKDYWIVFNPAFLLFSTERERWRCYILGDADVL